MIRVTALELTPDGAERPIPLDDAGPEPVELARQLAGRQMHVHEVLAVIRNVAAMYGTIAKIEVVRRF